MDRLPGVSVVVATLNGEDHILTQLMSITDQSVKPLEIIIGDDRSDDRTVELARDFSTTTDVPVRIEVNPERLGYAENFLRTAAKARGRLTAFSDQDDKWLPNRLAVATRALSESNSTIWVSGWVIADENLEPLPDRWFHTGVVERTAAAHPLGVIHGSRLVFRSDLLDHLPASGRPASLNGDGPASHDEWICFAARVLGTFAFAREPLMLYRRHPTAHTSANPGVASRGFMLSRSAEGPLEAWHKAAAQRADYLRTRAGMAEEPRIRDRMIAGASTYDRLAPRLARRVNARTLPTGPKRTAALLKGVLRGDYGRVSNGGLGVWALAQDLYNLT